MHRDEIYTFALFRDCGIPLMLGKLPGYANGYGNAITADEIDEFGIDQG